jgi:hypothetical protein
VDPEGSKEAPKGCSPPSAWGAEFGNDSIGYVKESRARAWIIGAKGAVGSQSKKAKEEAESVVDNG